MMGRNHVIRNPLDRHRVLVSQTGRHNTTCLTFRAAFETIVQVLSTRCESFSDVLRPENGERRAAESWKFSSTKTNSMMITKLEFTGTVMSGAGLINIGLRFEHVVIQCSG